MKSTSKTLFAVCCVALATMFAVPAFAGGRTHVKGYTKRNGTYVAPHFKTAPDKSKLNNYSTKGNVNPYTGKKGTVAPTKK